MALVLVSVIVLGYQPSVALADDGLHVTSSSAESRFPEGILFRVHAEGPSDITAITVRFQVLGQRALRYDNLEFAPAASMEGEILVRTDTANRFVPPGAELDYFFEVQDAGGTTVTTSPQRLILLDPRFDWVRIEAESASIHYYGPVEPLARMVLDEAQATVRRMAPVLGASGEQPLRLTMYNSWSDMRLALPPRSQVKENSLIIEGVLFPATGVILVLGGVPRVDGVTSHEVVHFLMDEVMGPRGRLVPAWLNEGLAVYGATVTDPSYDAALSRALAEGRLIPLTSLNIAPGPPGDVILMYGQGNSVVTFMVETFGAEKLRELLRSLRGGLAIDGALEATYGFDRVGLERRWREAIGAPSLPEGGLRRSRPTPVPYPTIVPFGAETPTPFPSPVQAPAQPPAPGKQGACARGSEVGDGGLLGLAALGMFLAVRRASPGKGLGISLAREALGFRWSLLFIRQRRR